MKNHAVPTQVPTFVKKPSDSINKLNLCGYALGGFFILAVNAPALFDVPADAPALVAKEYHEHFLKPGASKTGLGALDERKVFNYLRANTGADAGLELVQKLAKTVVRLAKEHDIPAGLILSIMKVESNFRPWAVSNKGALGLMQLMPDTGEWLAGQKALPWEGPATLLNEEMNVLYGVTYLGYLKQKYSGDLKKMLAAYNQGPAKVDEDVAEGRSLALGYYQKVRDYLPGTHGQSAKMGL